MLRVAILVALVAAASAVSPFQNVATAPSFPNANPERFIPVNEFILATPYTDKGAGFFQVLSNNAAVPANLLETVRTYFGDAGRERFQDDRGRGIQPQSHLFLSELTNGQATQTELKDPRFVQQTLTQTLNAFTVVPELQRRYQSNGINVGDVVYALPTELVNSPPAFETTLLNGVTYTLIPIRAVLGKYTGGLRVNGGFYPSHIVNGN